MARALRHLLDEFCALFCGCDDRPQIVFHLSQATEQTGPVVPTPQYLAPPNLEIEIVVSFDITDSQDIVLKIDVGNIKDKKGNPATLDGAPEWFVDNPALVGLTIAADGLSCSVSAIGLIGAAIVTVKADGKQGPEVKELVGSAQINIGAGDAAEIVLSGDAPTEQP